jgi:hypothetical protein
VVIAFLGIVQALLNLLRPDWLRLMVLYRALTAAAWIVILFFAIKAGHWVVLAPDASQVEGFRRTANILNQITVYSAAGLAAVSVYNLVRHFRRLLSLSRPSSESLQKGHNHA